jgi:hypothetical protein
MTAARRTTPMLAASDPETRAFARTGLTSLLSGASPCCLFGRAMSHG